MADSTLYDAVIVGGGPAGLSAAIYLARARCRVLVVERDLVGGQITITADVVNYPGIATASGKQITETMHQQALAFGAEFLKADVTGMDLDDPVKIISTSAGDLRCFGVILAPGARPRPAGFAGEQEFRGRGVAYCATCDGEFFTGMDVFVVGGGLSAAQESLFLTRYARHVTMLVRRDELSCPRGVAEQVQANPTITVRFTTVLDEVHGDTMLRGATLRDTATGTVEHYEPPAGQGFGVFVFTGYAPATDIVAGTVELTDDGHIVTDADMRTSVDGVYAAGDVRVKMLRQMITAASDGAIAATQLEHHIARMQERTGLVPHTPVPARPATQADAPVSHEPPSGFLTPEMRAQLVALFAKLERPVQLRASLDDRPISDEVRGFLAEFTTVSDRVDAVLEQPASSGHLLPRIEIWADGTDTGLSFHGVPGGHEFSSFVIGVYNAGGPGQPLDAATRARIDAIGQPLDVKILVSLSCTMCPTTVMAAQQIAALNPHVRASVFDLNHFPALREKYSVMSVPCMIVDDTDVHFGAMTVPRVLDAIGA